MQKAKGGRPKATNPKKVVNLRLDSDVYTYIQSLAQKNKKASVAAYLNEFFREMMTSRKEASTVDKIYDLLVDAKSRGKL